MMESVIIRNIFPYIFPKSFILHKTFYFSILSLLKIYLALGQMTNQCLFWLAIFFLKYIFYIKLFMIYSKNIFAK